MFSFKARRYLITVYSNHIHLVNHFGRRTMGALFGVTRPGSSFAVFLPEIFLNPKLSPYRACGHPRQRSPPPADFC